jgi:hypothetical protein
VHISSCWCICLVCSIFLYFPTIHVISPFRELFFFSLSPGYFPQIVLWLTDVSTIFIKGTVFSKKSKRQLQQYSVASKYRRKYRKLSTEDNSKRLEKCNTFFCKYARIICNWNKEREFCKK